MKKHTRFRSLCALLIPVLCLMPCRHSLAGLLPEITDDMFGSNERTCTWAENGSMAELAGSPAEDFSFCDDGDGTCTVMEYTGNDTVIVIPKKDPEGKGGIWQSSLLETDAWAGKL